LASKIIAVTESSKRLLKKKNVEGGKGFSSSTKIIKE